MFSLQRFNLWKRHTAHRSEVREKWRIWISSLLRWLDPHSSRCHRLQRQIWTGKYECSCQYEPAETSLTVCVCVCVCRSASVWMSSMTLSQQSCVLFVSARRRDCQRFCFWSCLQPTEEEEGEKRREEREEGEKGGERGEKGGERQERGGERRTRRRRERTDNSVGWMSAEVSHCCCRRTLPETHLRGKWTNWTWKQTNVCPPEVGTLHRLAHF